MPVGAGQVYPPITLQQISLTLYGDHGKEQFAAFCLFVRTLPLNFALLGRKRKYIKSKTTAKLKGKKNLDLRSPRPIPIICHLPDPPPFWLSTTFKLNPKLSFFVETRTTGRLATTAATATDRHIRKIKYQRRLYVNR